MEMTTRGLPIIGDTTDLAWVGRDDYEQMLKEYGLNPTRKNHKGTFEAIHSNLTFNGKALANPREDIRPSGYTSMSTSGGPEENSYKMLFAVLLSDLAIRGHWLKGWSKDVVYPITNQPNEHETSWVYPKHLRKPNE